MALVDWREHHGDAFEGLRVLVTGGAGFIGSHLAEALFSLGAEVVILDSLVGGAVENFRVWAGGAGPPRLTFYERPLSDVAALREAVSGCTYVFHQAALGSVPRSVERPAEFFESNVAGTANVLEAARELGVRRVVFAASSSAYGDSEVLPKVESMQTRSKSPYAATKVAGEALMRAYASSYAMDAVSLRYFNIFGPRQNANSAYAAVIAAFAKALLAGERPMIFGDGQQSRDFTFVDNAVHANLLAARRPERLDGEVINVACGERVTVNELATQMAQMLGRPDLTPVYAEERAGDVKHSLADLSLADAMLGYRPLVSFAAGLEPTVRWYRGVLAG